MIIKVCVMKLLQKSKCSITGRTAETSVLDRQNTLPFLCTTFKKISHWFNCQSLGLESLSVVVLGAQNVSGKWQIVA